MAEESKQKNKKSALEELKRIQEADHAAGIHYNEPELKHFDAQSVFNVDDKKTEKKPERKSAFHLGKRANRNKTTRVQVHSQAFENTSMEIEDVTLAPREKPRRHQAPMNPAEEVRARQVQQMKESLAHEKDVADEKVKVWKPKEKRDEELESTPVDQAEPVKEVEPVPVVEPEAAPVQEEAEPAPVEEPEPTTPIEEAHPESEEVSKKPEEVAQPQEIEEASEDELIEELAVVDKTEEEEEKAAEEEEKPVNVDEKEIESLIQKSEATPDHDDIKLVKVEEEKPKKPQKEKLEISLDEVLQVVDASKSKNVDIDTSNGKVMDLDEDDDIDVVDVEDTDDATKDEVEDEMDIPVMDMDEEENQPEPSEKTSEDTEERKMPEEIDPSQAAISVEPEDEDIEVVDLDDEEVDEEEDLEPEAIPEGDLYEEKKRFLLSEYVKEEDYLERQSQRGYHYVRRDGKRFVFVKGDPKDYYYLLNYYENEPSAQMKSQWKRDGWKLLSVSPSKDKKAAGWFVLRNEEQPGEYRKTIDNEQEKYEFFRKYRNSVRSTLFFIFICMACCVVTGVLQVMAQGFLFGIACCVVLFIVALIAFITYSRMLRGATKQANLLNARLRLRKREDAIDEDKQESDEQLDSEWEKVEEE